MNSDAVRTEASASHVGSSETEMALHSCPRLRPRNLFTGQYSALRKGRQLWVRRYPLVKSHSWDRAIPGQMRALVLTGDLVRDHSIHYSSGSQSGVPKPESSALPGNLLQVQNLRCQPRPTDSETLHVRFSSLCFNKPSQ